MVNLDHHVRISASYAPYIASLYPEKLISTKWVLGTVFVMVMMLGNIFSFLCESELNNFQTVSV